MSVKFLVDSASDIDGCEAEELGIDLIPMQVNIGGEEYLDGINLTHAEFFQKLAAHSEIPKTSQINEYRFDERFSRLTENGDEVVAVVMSSKLSGTYSNAVRAAEKYGGKVRVVDSLNVSLGERILIKYGLDLAKEGRSAEEISRTLDDEKKRIKLLALMDTLEYLRKGGRISLVASIVGRILSVKPVIAIVGGAVRVIGKAIGSKQGNNLLSRLIAKSNGVDFGKPVSAAYSGLSSDAVDKYLADLEPLWKPYVDEVPKYMIGSTIGTHIGPGAIAVAFFEKQQ